ncbi:MAG TPA: YbaN family protein [Xanthomonadaceae bacterium]|nr:YbaN family protein [Xanthomonadaceae bacterium]
MFPPSVLRIALLAVGWSSVGLAFLGAILPLLPTTPFVLLAAGCFSRASERCRAWLERAPLLGPILVGYESGLGITLRVKMIALGSLWGGMSFAVLYVAEALPLRLVLLASGIVASALILSQKTRTA